MLVAVCIPYYRLYQSLQRNLNKAETSVSKRLGIGEQLVVMGSGNTREVWGWGSGGYRRTMGKLGT